MFMPRALAKTLDHIARAAVGKDWSIYAALIDRWPEIVGTEYARITTPVKITFPYQPDAPKRSGGMLSVRLPKGLAMEFTFKTEQIRQRINSYFGYDAVSKIIFEPVYHAQPDHHAGPPPELKPEEIEALRETTLAIEDPDLRAAVAGFGEALLKGQKRD